MGALRTLQIEEGQADPVLDSLCNLVCSLLNVRIAGAGKTLPLVVSLLAVGLVLMHHYVGGSGPAKGFGVAVCRLCAVLV